MRKKHIRDYRICEICSNRLRFRNCYVLELSKITEREEVDGEELWAPTIFESGNICTLCYKGLIRILPFLNWNEHERK